MAKHLMCNTRIYNTWRDMRHRCNCQTHRLFKYYGERGISVCKEWNDSENGFINFYNWALNNGYTDELTIDRVDVNGNYSPENCRWVSMSVQNANRRSAGKCEYIGVFLHSNQSSYCTQIKLNGEILFSYSSQSKNDCAEKRNEFIKTHGLMNPLNEIREEYEDVRKHKNDRMYVAISKVDGSEIYMKKLADLANKVHLSQGFINECISGKRNSSKYIFRKEVLEDDNAVM